MARDVVDRLFRAIRSVQQGVEHVDQQVKTLDTELRKTRHPLEAGLSLVGKVEMRTAKAEKKPEGEKSNHGLVVEDCPTCVWPQVKVQLPTREETTHELRRRLVKEIARAEGDLTNRLKIAGKPCDCLDAKHNLIIEAEAEELISREPGNGVYQEIIDWLKTNQHKLTPEASASKRYDEEYPRMSGELAQFRKRVMGTEAG